MRAVVILVVSTAAVLAGCAAPPPTALICDGVSWEKSQPEIQHAESDWSLLISPASWFDRKTGSEWGWGRVNLDTQGLMLSLNFNFVMEADQTLIMKQLTLRQGVFDRVTGNLEVTTDDHELRMKCRPSSKLV